MNIQFTSTVLEPVPDPMWFPEPYEVLPTGVKNIQLTSSGDVLLWGTNMNCFSMNHFMNPKPLTIPAGLVNKPKYETSGSAGKFIGGLGENRVHQTLADSGISPEDILMPLLTLTDDGQKEISDGILLSGSHAFIFQVKTTMPQKYDVEHFRRKLFNLKTAAYKQGVDSYELIQKNKVLQFRTFNGGTRTVRTADYNWSVISVLAFNEIPLMKPARVFMANSSPIIPHAVFSLKEWEDLFSILNPEDAIKFIHTQTSGPAQHFGWGILKLFEQINLGVFSPKKKSCCG